MTEKSIDFLFTELSVLKREVEASLLVQDRLYADDSFSMDAKEIKVHCMKLTSMVKSVASMHATFNHYLLLTHMRLGFDRAYTEFQLALHAETGE